MLYSMPQYRHGAHRTLSHSMYYSPARIRNNVRYIIIHCLRSLVFACVSLFMMNICSIPNIHTRTHTYGNHLLPIETRKQCTCTSECSYPYVLPIITQTMSLSLIAHLIAHRTAPLQIRTIDSWQSPGDSLKILQTSRLVWFFHGSADIMLRKALCRVTKSEKWNKNEPQKTKTLVCVCVCVYFGRV